MQDGKKKRGTAKIASLEDDSIDVVFQRRLLLAEGKLHFEHECEYLAKWFNDQQKIQPVGGKKRSISIDRVREKFRERGYNADIYQNMRQMCLDCLLRSARSFLSAYEGEVEAPDERLLKAAHAFRATYEYEDEHALQAVREFIAAHKKANLEQKF